MLPATLIAGDTFAHTETWADYPASAGWVGKLRLVARTGVAAPVELTAAASGDAQLFSASAVTTAAWTAGAYTAVLWAEKAGEVRTVRSDQVAIAPDPRAIAAGTDTRGLAQKTVDDLKAARSEWARTQGRTRSYKIADRERTYATSAELDAELRYWEGQLAAENAAARLAAGFRPKNRILTRFTRPR